jgi:hypothetical protein
MPFAPTIVIQRCQGYPPPPRRRVSYESASTSRAIHMPAVRHRVEGMDAVTGISSPCASVIACIEGSDLFVAHIIPVAPACHVLSGGTGVIPAR